MRAIAEAKVFRDAIALILGLARAHRNLAIGRHRAFILTIDDHHIDLVARVILGG